MLTLPTRAWKDAMTEPLPKRPLRHPALIGTGVVLLAAIGIALAVFRPWQAAPPTIAVVRQTLREVIEISGAVESRHGVTLKASGTGTVASQVIGTGQRTTQGQALLRLSPAKPGLSLTQARATQAAAVGQAQVQAASARNSLAETTRRQQVALASLRHRIKKATSALAFSRAEFAVDEALGAEGALSAQAVAAKRQGLAQATLDLALARDELARTASGAEVVAARNAQAQAEVAAATTVVTQQAGVALAQQALADATLLAPFAGSITAWLVEPGDWVTPGTPLAEFQDLGSLRLRLPADELDLPKLRLGGPVSITFDAFPDRTIVGRIDEVSKASVTGTGNVQVFPIWVSFHDPKGLVRPGMSGDARILVRELPGVLALPVGAVRREGNGYAVTVVSGRRSTPRPVVIGAATLQLVEIKSGLQAGDRVQYAGAGKAP
jgi:RND family efflux transporter MFP subunit